MVFLPHYPSEVTRSRRFRDSQSRRAFSSYESFLSVSLFNRRTECVVFHPCSDQLLAASHGGEIALVKDLTGLSLLRSPDPSDIDGRVAMLRQGIGKGGSIVHMHMSRDGELLTFASHDCSLVQAHLSYEGRGERGGRDQGRYDLHEREIANTGDYDHWFTCSAASESTSALLATDNKGFLHLFDVREAHSMGSLRIHNSHKISHIDVHRNGFVFATASNDKTSRVFDLRFLRQEEGIKASPMASPHRRELAIYSHEGVVSSCAFSPTEDLLLTTAQNDELRVHSLSEAGELSPPRVILKHSHRFYQHISIIKAVWHPVAPGLVAVGRYDTGRGLDMIDVSSPSFVPADDEDLADYASVNLQAKSVDTILCVNAFSRNGDYLASGTSSAVVLWRHRRSRNDDIDDDDNRRHECVRASRVTAHNLNGSAEEEFSKAGGAVATIQDRVQLALQAQEKGLKRCNQLAKDNRKKKMPSTAIVSPICVSEPSSDATLTCSDFSSFKCDV